MWIPPSIMRRTTAFQVARPNPKASQRQDGTSRQDGAENNYTGKLPNSFNNQNNLGLGASYIGKSGYTGISIERINNNYGIPPPRVARLTNRKIAMTFSMKRAIHLATSLQSSSVRPIAITTILNSDPMVLLLLCGKTSPMKRALIYRIRISWDGKAVSVRKSHAHHSRLPI
jgi:hypothetical protein